MVSGGTTPRIPQQHGKTKQRLVRSVISSFRREVEKKCAHLGHCATRTGNFLLTFREKLSGPVFGGQVFRGGFLNPEDGTRCCPETSAWNYHYHNNAVLKQQLGSNSGRLPQQKNSRYTLVRASAYTRL